MDNRRGTIGLFQPKKGDGGLTPAMARRLKIVVVVVACILGIAFGVASASLGHRLLVPFGQPTGQLETGRQIDLEDFQSMILGGRDSGQSSRSPESQPSGGESL